MVKMMIDEINNYWKPIMALLLVIFSLISYIYTSNLADIKEALRKIQASQGTVIMQVTKNQTTIETLKGLHGIK